VQLQRIEIRNYRCFVDFALDVDGTSMLVIAPNAGGKTSLLTAVRMALRGGSTIRRTDFADPTQPMEVIATVGGIPPGAHATFAGALTFSNPPILRVGVRATWDSDESEVEHVFGFPDDTWKRAGREARDNLPLVWLPAWRDAAKLLSFVGSTSLLDSVISTLDINQALDQALAAVATAGEQLAQTAALQQMLTALCDELAGLLPNVAVGAYSIEASVAEPRDLLRQFELMLSHNGPATAAIAQSGGLSQLSIFTLALRILSAASDALLLVDEPEQALHPHAQRALVEAVRNRAGQSLISTHSPNILDRVDPRRITRLRRDPGGDTEAILAGQISDVNARRLARYSTAQTAEAYFAQTVVLFEGISDLLAFRESARCHTLNLDAAAVTLLSLDGANVFSTYLELLGPRGLDLRILGLVDADKEADWIAALSGAGIGVTDRPGLNAAGVEVSDPDLEAELLSALTTTEVEQIIDADGQLQVFQTFASRPEHVGLPLDQQQLSFIKERKVRWAPLLAAEIDPQNTPSPIAQLLGKI
jgi:predicted ATP-dependent endonuclease of OLD family